MKLYLLTIVAGVVLTQHSFAAGSGMTFLKLGIGARSIGMGEASAAVAQDPTATFYNPAGLARSTGPRISLMHKEWMQGTRTEFLGAITRWKSLTFGLGLNTTSVRDIEIRTTPGPSKGTFSSQNSSLGLSMGFNLSSCLSAGITGNVLYERLLTDDATGYGINVGALYSAPMDVSLALVINNIGAMSSLAQSSSSLPTSIRLGAARAFQAASMKSVITASTDIVSYTGEGSTHIHAGGELQYDSIFAVRAGFLSGYEARSITAGVGILYGILTLDYAYVPFKTNFGSAHTISLDVTL